MILVSIILAPIVSLVVTPIFCLLRKMFYVPLIRNKLLKDAQEKGNVVVAHYVKSHEIMNDNGEFGSTSSGKSIGIYQYQYGGKNYKYKIVTRDHMPDEITLYFSKKPGKATLADEIGLRESHWFIYYLILSLIIAVVIFFLGVNYIAS